MKRRRPAEIDLTPLIDVVFIILIFFVLTSSFSKNERALDLSLPETEKAELVPNEEDKINVEIKNDQLAFNGEILSTDEFDSRLSAVISKEIPVHTRIDSDVVYSRIVEVLDILNKYNLGNIVLVTEQKN